MTVMTFVVVLFTISVVARAARLFVISIVAPISWVPVLPTISGAIRARGAARCRAAGPSTRCPPESPVILIQHLDEDLAAPYVAPKEGSKLSFQVRAIETGIRLNETIGRLDLLAVSRRFGGRACIGHRKVIDRFD